MRFFLLSCISVVSAVLAVIVFKPFFAGGRAEPDNAALWNPVLAGEKGSLDSPSYTFKCQPVINEDQPDFTLTVPIVNQTDRVVEFQQISTSCGCSKSTLDAYVLRAGDRTTLRISLNLHGRSGMQRISAILQEKSGPSWRYVIEVPVFPRARISQSAERLSVPRCQPQSVLEGSATIELFADRRSALPELTGLRVSDASCQAEHQAPEELEIATNIWVRRVPVRFSLTAPSKPGAFCATVTATYRCSDEQRDCSLDISGVVLSLFEVAPPYVFLSHADNDKLPSQKVIISRTDGEPISVETVPRAETDDIDVKILPNSRGSSVILELSLRPSALARTIWGEAVLKTNHGKQPTIRVPFAAVPKKQ
ncbi:MAG: hypothetical protein L0Y72_17010 [Gemmataceae bacterium]|nr:hypothetical protein [Gemmataceae bacterium]